MNILKFGIPKGSLEDATVSLFKQAGWSVGVSVCEDIWNDELFWPRRIYQRDPVAELVARGAGLIVNLSASPYHRGKCASRDRPHRQVHDDQSDEQGPDRVTA